MIYIIHSLFLSNSMHYSFLWMTRIIFSPVITGLHEVVLEKIQVKHPANIYIVYVNASQNPIRCGLIPRSKFLHNQTHCCFENHCLIWIISFLAVTNFTSFCTLKRICLQISQVDFTFIKCLLVISNLIFITVLIK